MNLGIGFCGYDIITNELFPPIIEAAQKAGHTTIRVPAQEKGASLRFLKAIENNCDAVIFNPSSFTLNEEIALWEALHPNIVKIVEEDLPGIAIRQLMKKFAHQADAVIAAHSVVVPQLKEFGYPNVVTKFKHQGEWIDLIPPPHMGIKYREISSTKNIRPELQKVDNTGMAWPVASGDDIIIAIPGFKNPPLVTNILKIVCTAGKKVFGERFVVALNPHPVEQPKDRQQDPAYLQTLKERNEILKSVWSIDTAPWSNLQLLRAANIQFFAYRSNDVLLAPYVGWKSIYYIDEWVHSHNAAQGAAGDWWIAEPEYGGAYKVTDEESVTSIFLALTDIEAVTHFRRKQERNFPLPKNWDTAPNIIKFIERMVKAKHEAI